MKIDKNLKIRLLQAIATGKINMADFPEFIEERYKMAESYIETLSDEEKALLLKMAREGNGIIIHNNN